MKIYWYTISIAWHDLLFIKDFTKALSVKFAGLPAISRSFQNLAAQRNVLMSSNVNVKVTFSKTILVYKTILNYKTILKPVQTKCRNVMITKMLYNWNYEHIDGVF